MANSKHTIFFVHKLFPYCKNYHNRFFFRQASESEPQVSTWKWFSSIKAHQDEYSPLTVIFSQPTQLTGLLLYGENRRRKE